MAKEHPHSPPALEFQDGLFHQAMNLLKQAGYKRTAHREALIRFFIKNQGPFSTDTVQGMNKNLDKVTIYRSLAKFEEINLLRRIDFGDGIIRYESNLRDSDHHHHVVCIKCSKVEAIEHCEINGIEQIEKQTGFTSLRHSLEFFGVCPQCQ